MIDLSDLSRNRWDSDVSIIVLSPSHIDVYRGGKVEYIGVNGKCTALNKDLVADA
jgi:hypothetical protein